MARNIRLDYEILEEGSSGPIVELFKIPTITINVGKMHEENLRRYKEQVEDIDAVSDHVDDLCEKLLALHALKDQPEVLDGRMFTPAKQRPAKRQAESSARVKPASKPRTKKIKEENVASNLNTEVSQPKRVLRSNTRSNIHSSTASSSNNSTANTVIEVSGYGRTKISQAKAVTTPVHRTPVAQTSVRSNSKAPTGDVKLTPLQKKELKMEEKRQELLRKIEEKDKRLENKQAEKKKIDILRKAQAELNKTPVNHRGIRTPVGKKQIPMRRNNLNITPMAGSSSLSNSSAGSYKCQPLRLHNSNSKKILNDTPSTYKTAMKLTPLSNSASKKARPAKPPRAAPARAGRAITANTISGAASQATKVKAPVVERHVDFSQPGASVLQVKALIHQNDQPAIMELSPIRSDNTVTNIPLDISLMNPVLDFDNIDAFNVQNKIASTFLEETVFPHVAFAQQPEPTPKKTVQIDATFDVENVKENNYEITQYMNDSQADPEQEYRNGKKIPHWARGRALKEAIDDQFLNGDDFHADWPPMAFFISKEAFDGVNDDSYILKRLENRDDSLAWNPQFL